MSIRKDINAEINSYLDDLAERGPSVDCLMGFPRRF